MQKESLRDYGPPGTPRDIINARKNVADLLRAMGQPVVHLHAWNVEDVRNGLAKRCPACISTYSHQPSLNCDICFGQGFVSVANADNLWIDANGDATVTPTDTPAPKYGGFGEPVITRILRADVPTDVFTTNEQGIMVRVQTARVSSFWTPLMGDRDLMVMVGVARDGVTVNNTYDRYELLETQPSTLPAHQTSYGSTRERVGQTFEMTRLDLVTNANLYKVPIGGVHYGAI